MSRLDVIAGPNGAGKTTLYERTIAPDRPGLPFVNADRIAADRFPGDEVAQAYAAAEFAADARAALIDARLDFCTETVFYHPSKVELVTAAAEVAAYRHGTADYPPRWPVWTPEPLLAH